MSNPKESESLAKCIDTASGHKLLFERQTLESEGDQIMVYVVDHENTKWRPSEILDEDQDQYDKPLNRYQIKDLYEDAFGIAHLHQIENKCILPKMYDCRPSLCWERHPPKKEKYQWVLVFRSLGLRIELSSPLDLMKAEAIVRSYKDKVEKICLFTEKGRPLLWIKPSSIIAHTEKKDEASSWTFLEDMKEITVQTPPHEKLDVRRYKKEMHDVIMRRY